MQGNQKVRTVRPKRLDLIRAPIRVPNSAGDLVLPGDRARNYLRSNSVEVNLSTPAWISKKKINSQQSFSTTCLKNSTSLRRYC